MMSPSAPTTTVNSVKSIINSYQQTTAQLLDPRSSSDFSELIAKKAAEKRAKFQESKPLTSNAVTFNMSDMASGGGGGGGMVTTKFIDDSVGSLCSSLSRALPVTAAAALFSEKDEEDTASLNSNKTDMNSNRNESFINTASKLLERVKQQQHQQHHSISNNSDIDMSSSSCSSSKTSSLANTPSATLLKKQPISNENNNFNF
jgi:hypothetical protein